MTSTKRVLIADDNEDAAESLSILLQLAGHQTLVVMDGAQAVKQATELLPDVAILDIGMPLLDGLAAARAIRSLPTGRTTLLIALSGLGRPEDRRRCAEAGFDMHFVKPVDIEQVKSVLNNHPAGIDRRATPTSESGI